MGVLEAREMLFRIEEGLEQASRDTMVKELKTTYLLYAGMIRSVLDELPSREYKELTSNEEAFIQNLRINTSVVKEVFAPYTGMKSAPPITK